MIKKLTHLLAILFLLISTSGVSVNSHFCEGKLVSVSIDHEANSCCSGMDKACKKCKDVSHIYKVQDEYVPGQVQQVNPLLSFSFLSDLFFLYSNTFTLYGVKTAESLHFAPYLSPFQNHIVVSIGGLRAPPFLVNNIC